MANPHELQVMQETLRGILLALCDAAPVDRAAFARNLSAMAFSPGIDPQTRLCLQDLATRLPAIASSAGPSQ